MAADTSGKASGKTADKTALMMKYDSRLVEQNLRNGVVTKEELEAKMKEIPDSAANVESFQFEELNSPASVPSDERH